MGEKAAAADDVGDGMQCADHPLRANPGGICAFCLQEKLGKLVSSSSPSSFFPPLPPTSSNSVTSSTSSSFRSSSDFPPTSSKILTFLNNNKKKQAPPPPPPPPPAVPSSAARAAALALKRSKSVAPRPVGDIVAAADSPRKKSFWSFLSLSSSSSSSSATTTTDKRRSTDVQPQFSLHQHQDDESTIMKTIGDQDEESPSGGSQVSSSSFGRKVARSRSVGCGSRSFSGDFLDRISTGFGDCALRRVESQRESSKHGANSKMLMRHQGPESRIKERVRCGGIFGGFGMISSLYWLSAEDDGDGDDFGSTSSRMSSNARRNRSWGWAFASPMRVFKPVPASKSFGPANAVASINSSTRGARIGNRNGNSPSSSLAAVVGR